ncbi:MAG: hypothetical protein ACKPKO_60025, partial [Candidatus Fonsibacter sp.]
GMTFYKTTARYKPFLSHELLKIISKNSIMYVKFRFNNERLWMKVEYIYGMHIYGRLDNHPINSELKYGDMMEVPYF